MNDSRVNELTRRRREKTGKIPICRQAGVARKRSPMRSGRTRNNHWQDVSIRLLMNGARRHCGGRESGVAWNRSEMASETRRRREQRRGRKERQPRSRPTQPDNPRRLRSWSRREADAAAAPRVEMSAQFARRACRARSTVVPRAIRNIPRCSRAAYPEGRIDLIAIVTRRTSTSRRFSTYEIQADREMKLSKSFDWHNRGSLRRSWRILRLAKVYSIFGKLFSQVLRDFSIKW